MKLYSRFIIYILLLLGIFTLLFIIFLSALNTTTRHLYRKLSAEITHNKLNPNDSEQLIDLQNFTYIMTQPECSDNVVALFLVHSAPGNVRHRAIIRETWGQKIWFNNQTTFRLMFLLGAVVTQTLQDDLQRENAIHHDLVQGNFIDHYRNMTYKHMMAYKWYLYHCRLAKLLVKLDDDILVNTPQLIKYQELGNQLFPEPISRQRSFIPMFDLFNDKKNLILCRAWLWVRPNRSYRSKWRVGKHEYEKEFYPPYCAGAAIIYTTDVVFRLYREQQNSPYFWIDDLQLTGILAYRLNIPVTDMVPYILGIDEIVSIMNNESEVTDYEFMFARYHISDDQFRKIWQLIQLNYDLNPKPMFSKF